MGIPETRNAVAMAMSGMTEEQQKAFNEWIWKPIRDKFDIDWGHEKIRRV
jgi:hypothetical protein